MGETQKPHFYDFWNFGRVPETPKPILFLWRHKGLFMYFSGRLVRGTVPENMFRIVFCIDLLLVFVSVFETILDKC